MHAHRTHILAPNSHTCNTRMYGDFVARTKHGRKKRNNDTTVVVATAAVTLDGYAHERDFFFFLFCFGIFFSISFTLHFTSRSHRTNQSKEGEKANQTPKYRNCESKSVRQTSTFSMVRCTHNSQPVCARTTSCYARWCSRLGTWKHVKWWQPHMMAKPLAEKI